MFDDSALPMVYRGYCQYREMYVEWAQGYHDKTFSKKRSPTKRRQMVHQMVQGEWFGLGLEVSVRFRVTTICREPFFVN